MYESNPLWVIFPSNRPLPLLLALPLSPRNETLHNSHRPIFVTPAKHVRVLSHFPNGIQRKMRPVISRMRLYGERRDVHSNDDTIRTVSGVRRNTASCAGGLCGTHRRIHAKSLFDSSVPSLIESDRLEEGNEGSGCFGIMAQAK